MNAIKNLILGAGLMLVVAMAFAQASTSGTLVVIPAYGEVKQANDQADLRFLVEEQDSDRAAAASRVNLKMKQGMAAVHRADPHAVLATGGYYTYPVYPDNPPHNGKPAQPVAWRVGQYLDVQTTDLDGLPKTVAAAQQLMALNALHFGLSDDAEKRLDAARIEATYRNLVDRIGAVAKAMGRNSADAALESVDFEGAGMPPEGLAPKVMMRAMAVPAPIEAPDFEPGVTTLTMQATAKVRFH